MVGHLQLVVGRVVHGARIAVLGGRREELRAEDLGLLGHHGVDGHGAAVALRHVGAAELHAGEALVQRRPGGGRVGVLVLQLPGVRLLHHVRRRTQVARLQVLVAHDLRQGGGADALQGAHQVVGHGRSLREATLLAYARVHPGHPVALSASASAHGRSALIVGAGHGQVGQTRRVGVERHAADIFPHAHLAHVVPVTLQVVQGHGRRLMEGRRHGRRGHVRQVAVRRLQRIHRGEDGRRIQQVALPVQRLLLLHLAVLAAVLVALAAGAQLADLLGGQGWLQVAKVVVGGGEGRREAGGAKGAAVEPRAPDHVVLVQEADDVVVHALLGDVPWQLVEVVGDLAVGKVLQKDLGRLEAALAGCEEQWRLLLHSKIAKKKNRI